MRPLSEDDLTAWAAVDDALRTQLPAVPPLTFRAAVMARVRALQPAPRFRLHWLDFALSVFVAGMAGLALWLWPLVPPQLAAQVRLQLLDWQYHLRLPSLWPTLLALGAGLGILGLAGIIWVVWQSRLRRRWASHHPPTG